jgi:hypothetical protein
MLDSGVERVYAFLDRPGGTPGTNHTITEARRRKIPTRVITSWLAA